MLIQLIGKQELEKWKKEYQQEENLFLKASSHRLIHMIYNLVRGTYKLQRIEFNRWPPSNLRERES